MITTRRTGWFRIDGVLCPTPAEIERRTAEIRSKWSAEEQLRRYLRARNAEQYLDYDLPRWEMPTIRWASDDVE